MAAVRTSETAEQTDRQRRLRIQLSPVKSFYKTVPLDETGATDTEAPLMSVSEWPTSSLYATDGPHLLTDSLIVNAEEESELDANDDMKVGFPNKY
ncbi:unnamed protein product [Gongylonema pulchrum]|uniref:Uncharacterized protein n=1 Tax=Gongylonema pulchrum TaxID=637853 RepID=A0A3P7NH60_9BILA|nr:unnamed protein product [Gongylonema pulchrum]